MSAAPHNGSGYMLLVGGASHPRGNLDFLDGRA
jgi:hypothetical protein